jgi:pimeloyl-ACP methyl ester carboxylesterase
MVSLDLLLSARLFLAPQTWEGRVFFLSNLGQGGHLSLYAMDAGGSVPEPLLPPQIALQNPELIGGMSFALFPQQRQIVVMLDKDGDENYQPMVIPWDGGVPEAGFNGYFAGKRVALLHAEPEQNMLYFNADSREDALYRAYQANLATGAVRELGASPYGSFVAGMNEAHTRVLLIDGYRPGDTVLYEWRADLPERRLLHGVPMEQRTPDQEVPLNGLGPSFYVNGDQGLLVSTTLFSDAGGLGYLDLAHPETITEVAFVGLQHTGQGEFETIEHLHDNRYLLKFNIDGASWLYEAAFNATERQMFVVCVISGDSAPFTHGVAHGVSYEKPADRISLAFATATTPAQLFTISGAARKQQTQHTRERILGLPHEWMAQGEDASFTSFDGLRVSARLYLPAAPLGFTGPRPLVYYIHGGPQGQERPDFTWFSMPLIQFLTLNGFAVFVPNVRGSTGYGLRYMKYVERDWGGDDRLDHVHAMTRVLPQDARVDVRRAGVIGRSYGGYMTLTLAFRHPELWRAAVDMFGPYNLVSFIDRVPPTWRTFFAMSVGDPEKDRDFLLERSPSTYVDQLQCPMLVIQGQNDPRVIEQESHDVVDYLRGQGKQVEYLLFPDEGHDVLKFANRVTCYTAITDFFAKNLQG